MGCGCNKNNKNLPRARVPKRTPIKKNPMANATKKIRGPIPPKPGRRR